MPVYSHGSVHGVVGHQMYLKFANICKKLSIESTYRGIILIEIGKRRKEEWPPYKKDLLFLTKILIIGIILFKNDDNKGEILPKCPGGKIWEI